MTEKSYIKPWVVVRQLPDLRWRVIACYCSRADADGHLLLLRQRLPEMQFEVIFDTSSNPHC